MEDAKGSQSRHISGKGHSIGMAEMEGSQSLQTAIRCDREVSFHLLAARSRHNRVSTKEGELTHDESSDNRWHARDSCRRVRILHCCEHITHAAWKLLHFLYYFF